jgi:hypothetical protein
MGLQSKTTKLNDNFFVKIETYNKHIFKKTFFHVKKSKKNLVSILINGQVVVEDILVNFPGAKEKRGEILKFGK